MQDIAARTDGRLRLGPATLYGSIKRMLHDGLIEELDERPDPDKDDVRRRYYRITPHGRRVAMEENARLTKLVRQARGAGLHPKTRRSPWRPPAGFQRLLLRLSPAEFRDECALERTLILRAGSLSEPPARLWADVL